MKLTTITARDLDDAWFQCLANILEAGHEYTIDRGSYEGQKRLELDYVTVHIRWPGMRPLLPQIPPALGIPNPVAEGYLESYLPYLMTAIKQPGEDYTYGSYLEKQIQEVIRMYREDGFGTNQAYMTVGNPEAILLKDPPCLRGIDTRVKDGKLHFMPYFRCIAASERLLYKHDGVVVFDTLKSLHERFCSGSRIEVVCWDFDYNKVAWGKVTKSALRYADNIREYQSYGELPVAMTDEHWVFTGASKDECKQARYLQPKDDSFLRIMDLTSLKQSCNAYTSIDLFEILKDNSEYYLSGLELAEIKAVCSSGVAASWRDNRVLPINHVAEFYGLPDRATVHSRNSNKEFKRYMDLNEDFGYVCGAWLANGWFKPSSLLIAIGKGRDAAISLLHQSLAKCCIKYTTYFQGNAVITFIGNKLLRDVIAHLGFKSGAHNKEVPAFVYDAPAPFKRGLFRGWQDGDAGCTVSRNLAEGMRLIAAQVGILTSIYKDKPRQSTMPGGRTMQSSETYYVHEISGERRSPGNGLRMPKIKSIGSIYKSGEVIDLQVHPYANFCIGSGMQVVHNSWDLWNGFPANLGALQLMKEYMAGEIGVGDGEIIAASKGLHLYDYVWELARKRVSYHV